MSTAAPLSEGGRGRAGWLQCAITALVAAGDADASFRQDRDFALRFGADETTAMIWPLLVDGLLTMAIVELCKTGYGAAAAGGRPGRRSRSA